MTPSKQPARTASTPAIAAPFTFSVPSAYLLAASVLVAAPNAMAQGAALDAISNNEANQRQAAAAAVQRNAAKYFSVVTPGVVKDSRTGLQWMRCSLGQDWSEKAKTCTGSVRTYTWQGALDIAKKLNAVGGYAGSSNWRVPTMRELQSLRYCSNGFASDTRDLEDGRGSVQIYCADGYVQPIIAQAVFPNMDSDKYRYWSSTPYAGDSSYAWGVHFGNGGGSGDRTSSGAVRLVR